MLGRKDMLRVCGRIGMGRKFIDFRVAIVSWWWGERKGRDCLRCVASLLAVKTVGIERYSLLEYSSLSLRVHKVLNYINLELPVALQIPRMNENLRV